MIPAPNPITEIGDLPGEEIHFGIGDPRWVMRTQAELYSDVVTAIIREYSTNAYDANVMAGHRDPIQVSLPCLKNNNTFIVKDNGVGMNLDLFKRVYTQFGVSDKRESQDTNGMLGYGSKSGVAYTTRFQVTSIRDGIKIVGIIQRKPDWSIVLKVISTTKTDEPNGTEIRIPVHNIDEFNHKAREFYKFWLPGRVVIDGVEPEHYVGEKIAPNLYYSKQYATSYVVMGNVAYRIANPSALFINTKMSQLHFVAYVDDFKTDDGAAPVEFTPSREDLKYTDRTKSTLQAIIHQFEKDILVAATAQISNAKTHPEAYAMWSYWKDKLGKSLFADLEFKGDKFEDVFHIQAMRYDRNQSYNTTVRVRDWQISSMSNTLVVTEFDPTVSSHHKKKIKQYLGQVGMSARYILFTSAAAGDIKSPWIDKGSRFVTWENVKAAIPKAPRTGAGYRPTRIKGTFDYYTLNGFVSEADLPDDKDIFYIRVQTNHSFATYAALKHLGLDAAVVVLASNRIDKFVRENPSVRDFYEYARGQVVTDCATLLSDEAKKALSIDAFTQQWVSRLDVSKIDDPEIKNIKKIMSSRDALTSKYDANIEFARLIGRYNGLKMYEAAPYEYLRKTYPLLSDMRTYAPREHTYVYMNAVFSAVEKEKKDE